MQITLHNHTHTHVHTMHISTSDMPDNEPIFFALMRLLVWLMKTSRWCQAMKVRTLWPQVQSIHWPGKEYPSIHWYPDTQPGFGLLSKILWLSLCYIECRSTPFITCKKFNGECEDFIISGSFLGAVINDRPMSCRIEHDTTSHALAHPLSHTLSLSLSLLLKCNKPRATEPLQINHSTASSFFAQPQIDWILMTSQNDNDLKKL